MLPEKIAAIVEGGFKTKVTKALVSEPFPYYYHTSDNLALSAPTIFSGYTFDALVTEESVNVSAPVIFSGAVVTVSTEASIIEPMVVSAPIIYSGALITVVKNIETA